MRSPDLVIDGGNGPQTLRWHLWLPQWMRRRGWQLALHKWLQSDHDRALHDHKADNVSILLSGFYREVFSHAWEPFRAKTRWPLWPYFRKAETPHRVLLDKAPVWTLWLRWPERRNWGFVCKERGWIPHTQYLAENEDYYAVGTSTIGRGCDE